jgi:hypothetical protein
VAKRQNDTVKSLSSLEAGNSIQDNLRFCKWHRSCSIAKNRKRKKGGEIMKGLKANLSMMLLVGVLGASGAALAADGVVVEGELNPGSYCHMKFPAMTERSLGDNYPQLKQSGTGDVIDFYGPCDEDPTGKDQIASQKLEHQHQMEGSRGGEDGRF